MRRDSLLRLWRYINRLLTYLLIAANGTPSQSCGVTLVMHVRSHSVTCHPTQVNTLNPSQVGLLDLSTPEGWKAKLT